MIACSIAREPQLLEPADLHVREWFVRDVLECAAVPQAQGLARCAGHQPLEALRIDIVGIEPQLVSACTGDERGAVAARLERSAQPRDIGLQRLRRRRRRIRTPKALDQAVGRDGLGRIEREDREQRARLRTAEGHRPPIDADLHGSQEPDVHAATGIDPIRRRAAAATVVSPAAVRASGVTWYERRARCRLPEGLTPVI